MYIYAGKTGSCLKKRRARNEILVSFCTNIRKQKKRTPIHNFHYKLEEKQCLPLEGRFVMKKHTANGSNYLDLSIKC